MKFNDHFGVKSFFLLKARGVNNRDLNAYAVKTLRAWLMVGSRYLANFKIVEPPVMNCDVLLGQWNDLTLEAFQRDILDATDKIKMKRQKNERDEFVAKMGKEVRRMKKTMLNSNGSSCIICADNNKIIDIGDFTNLDAIV